MSRLKVALGPSSSLSIPASDVASIGVACPVRVWSGFGGPVPWGIAPGRWATGFAVTVGVEVNWTGPLVRFRVEAESEVAREDRESSWLPSVDAALELRPGGSLDLVSLPVPSGAPLSCLGLAEPPLVLCRSPMVS